MVAPLADWAAELLRDATRAAATCDELEAKRALERAAKLEEHRRACTLVFCDRCARFPCLTCGHVAVDAKGRKCSGCLLEEDLETFEKRIPPMFRDVLRDGRRAALDVRPIRLPSNVIDAALETAATWTAPPSLCLVGPLRSGKTSTAVALLGAWFCGQHVAQREKVNAARFITAINLGAAPEQHKLGSEAPLVREALSASLLVLDDVGQDHPRHADVIRSVVRERYDWKRPTIVTTWLSTAELAARYNDGGFAARVYEKSMRFGDTERAT